MARQSDAINLTLARNSGNWESINSIKVDHPKAGTISKSSNWHFLKHGYRPQDSKKPQA
jgi:hypothetical protein